jgi:hypothetical protein
MRLIYLCGRFTAPTAWEIECNVRRAEELAAEVAKLGAMPVTPHTNSRFFFGLTDTTPEFWYEGTLELLRRCDALILVPGWEDSKGVKMEREEAYRLMIPQFHYLPALKDWLADGGTNYYERYLPAQIPRSCPVCSAPFTSFREVAAHDHTKENV